jgi:hypothetical protein
MSKYCSAFTYRRFGAETDPLWSGYLGELNERFRGFSFVETVGDRVSSGGSRYAKPEFADSFSPFSLLLIYSMEYSSVS